MYKHFFKPLFDFLLSFLAIIILSPFFILFTPVVAVAMKGNPFFVQKRPGKNGKIFNMIKYRTMTNAKDEEGNLLPDADRLTKFGKLMRKLSLDELPEIFNILVGQMSIVGPRPLLVQYLTLYSERQARRHEVKPGLTGLAQVSGRNAISWEQKFEKDVYYVEHISIWLDIKIFFLTIVKIFKREGISQEGQATMEFFTGNTTADKEINVLILSAGRRVELVNLFKQARDKLRIKGVVIAADMSNTAPALYFADKKYLLPKIDDKKYLESLTDICIKEKVALVVPTIDTELEILSKNQKELESKTKSKILVSSYSCVRICGDKIRTASFFEEHGFEYPHTYTEKELDDGKYIFPLFIKPKDGSSSINAFRINQKEELDFFRKYVKNPIVQECVIGQEYTFDVFVDFDGELLSIVPRKRLAVRSGEILKGQIDMNAELIKQVENVVRALKPMGHITIQGICSGEKIYYIEINPRFGGGAPMSIMAGADSCEWLYKGLLGEKIDKDAIKVQDKALYARFDGSIKIS